MMYILLALCALLFFVVATLWLALSASSEVIEDLRRALKQRGGEQ